MMRLFIFAVLALKLISCRSLGSETSTPMEEKQSTITSDSMIATLSSADFLFWGDVLHQSPGSIETLRSVLPQLHAADYRRLYLEFSDYKQEDITAAMTAQTLTLAMMEWSGSQAPAWFELFKDLRKLGGWQILATDFKARGGIQSRLKDILRGPLKELTWCDHSIDSLDPLTRERVMDDRTSTMFARALGDTLSFQMFEDTWQADIKTVIFYGVAHGVTRPIVGSTYLQKPLGFMGFLLEQRFPGRFISVFPMPKAEHERDMWQLLVQTIDDQPKKVLIPAKQLAPPTARAYQQINYKDLYFIDDHCRSGFFDPSFKLADDFHYLYIE